MKTRKITIKVTAKDIKEGLCGSETMCPIARAARRVTKDRIRVDGKSLYVGRVGHGGRGYTLGTEAANFVWRFDSKQQVKPFTLTVRNSFTN